MRIGSIAALLCIAGSAMALEFGNAQLKMRFADAPAKGGLLGITDVKRGIEVLKPKKGNTDPLLWELRLSQVGSDQVTLTFNNRNAGNVEMTKISATQLKIIWSKIGKDDIGDAATVRLTVSFREDGAAVWDFQPELKLADYTFVSVIFPYIENVIDPKQERLLFPTGNVGSRFTTSRKLSGEYPSYNAQLEFFGIYGREKKTDGSWQTGGIYMGLEDPNAVRKHFEFSKGTLKVQTFAEDTSVAGKSRIPSYPVVIAASPDAWHSSALYRKWAKKQIWCRRGPVAEYVKKHPGSPDPRETELWMVLFPQDSLFIPTARQAAQEQSVLPGVKMTAHLYEWNGTSSERRYPNPFPAKPDFPEAAKILHEAGIAFFPYVNGRLWDRSAPDYWEAEMQGVMNADGSLVLEEYSETGPDYTPMCPSSKALHTKLAYAVDRLHEDFQIDGIYIDQISSMTPLACYDPAHGHPLNGGGWWQQRYREMLQPIVAKHRDHLLLFSENGAEPYIDTIDVFLLWGFAFQDDFPSLVAVYNQEATYMGSLALHYDSRIGFVSLLSRNLVWNVQPGWMGWLHGVARLENYPFQRQYVKRIIRMRRLARPVMENGLPAGDVIFAPQPEKVELTYEWSTWDRKNQPASPGRTRPVYGVWWQSDDGRTLLAPIANITDKPYTVNLVTTGELFEGRAGHEVVKIAENGRRTVIGKVGEKITLEVVPEALFLVEIQ